MGDAEQKLVQISDDAWDRGYQAALFAVECFVNEQQPKQEQLGDMMQLGKYNAYHSMRVTIERLKYTCEIPSDDTDPDKYKAFAKWMVREMAKGLVI